MKKNWKFTTKAVHIGSEIDETTGAVIPPIYQTSTFAQKSPGEHQGYEYTRSHNPTRTRLENCLASLENAKYALVTASGLSATDLILHSLPQNSNVLSDNDLYGGTFRQFETVYKESLNFSYLDMCDLEQVKQAISEKKPALIWLESLTNPTLKICDFRKIADIKKDALVVVDNTMLSPYFCNPNKLFYAVGPCQSPFDSWLVLKKNLPYFCEYLQRHPKVPRTLAIHRFLAKEMFRGFGSMVPAVTSAYFAFSKDAVDGSQVK